MRFSRLALVTAVAALLLGGCGGLTDTLGTSGNYTGVYRASLTRGTSTITISIDKTGNAKIVVTDDAATLPSFTGAGTVTTTNGTDTLAADLTGTDGSTATVAGTFGATSSIPNLTLNISGGLGANGLVAQQVSVATIYPGTWTGILDYTYTNNQGTTTPVRTTATYTIAADGSTLTGSGSLVDPSGNPATFTVKGIVDPSGLYSQTTTYTYNGVTQTTAVNYTGFLNVDFDTGLTMVGNQSATWGTGQVEQDVFAFNKATTANRKARAR